MAKRIAINSLNASTIDILNTIRQNASYEYQSSVPVVTTSNDIPKVGEVIYGTPALANQFLNSLINRIAAVRVQSATFNNPYSMLKKGYLEFGETVEDIFVNIAKVVTYNPEKTAEREFKRTLPDVRSAFHIMNWRTMYPVTIQDNDLKLAFVSVDGVTNLIAKIVDQIYTAAEYDEFLLFKYLIIKAVSHGKMYPVSVGDLTDLNKSAESFRGYSNVIEFMADKYNEAAVKTSTPKPRQCIFMDSMFNAQYDVNVLASAFNMDKADFMGRLFLIDDFTTFDNARWATIRDESDSVELVTDDELSLMKDVKAILVDENWFQVYDNLNKFTENNLASGLYWNYFYHTWKTVSSSPFSNAIAFVSSDATITSPDSVTAEIVSKETAEEGTVFAIQVQDDTASVANGFYSFVQTEELTTAGVAVTPYGRVTIPDSVSSTTELTLELVYAGVSYTTTTTINSTSTVGTTIVFNKVTA